MKTRVTSALCQIFEDWQVEDQRLEKEIEQIRDWMAEVNQLGIPHFGETASRLGPLRDQLEIHFRREDAMLATLEELYPEASPEVQLLKRQTGVDHKTLLSRLDQLHARLKALEPPFESWTAAMDDVDVLFEEMQRHERDESDRVKMLMPKECDDEGLKS